MDFVQKIKVLNKKTSEYIDIHSNHILNLIKENLYLIACLIVVAVVVYGFELFNFNLTIDEEVHAVSNGPIIGWIEQGRWAMYFLNKIILPYTIIPFFPLFLALLFQILSIILLVNIWADFTKVEKVIIGSIGLAYPGIAYAYTFSTINYGIGIGFFFCALSLWLFAKNNGLKSFYAIIPAVFAVSIYQGIIPTLIAVYLVYFIYQLINRNNSIYKQFLIFCVIIIAALLISRVIQFGVLKFYGLKESGYVGFNFDLTSIKQNFSILFNDFLQVMGKVYFGDKSIYSIQMRILAIVLIISIFGFLYKVIATKIPLINRVISIVLIIGLAVIPFLGGFLMNGFYAMRFLVALSIVIPGIVALGLNLKSPLYKLVFSIFAIFCISSFAQSANHLFASSNLALEADRILGQRLIERIDSAIDEVNNPVPVKYLEIIGYYDHAPTQLIPKTETFGMSFFEWDQGNAWRALFFLQTLGYQGMQALPENRRSTMIDLANDMSDWPKKGSVLAVADTVLVKFGPYSDSQKRKICTNVVRQSSNYSNLEDCISTLFTE